MLPITWAFNPKPILPGPEPPPLPSYLGLEHLDQGQLVLWRGPRQHPQGRQQRLHVHVRVSKCRTQGKQVQGRRRTQGKQVQDSGEADAGLRRWCKTRDTCSLLVGPSPLISFRPSGQCLHSRPTMPAPALQKLLRMPQTQYIQALQVTTRACRGQPFRPRKRRLKHNPSTQHCTACPIYPS